MRILIDLTLSDGDDDDDDDDEDDQTHIPRTRIKARDETDAGVKRFFKAGLTALCITTPPREKQLSQKVLDWVCFSSSFYELSDLT